MSTYDVIVYGHDGTSVASVTFSKSDDETNWYDAVHEADDLAYLHRGLAVKVYRDNREDEYELVYEAYEEER